jgi:hypothetical protein
MAVICYFIQYLFTNIGRRIRKEIDHFKDIIIDGGTIRKSDGTTKGNHAKRISVGQPSFEIPISIMQF